MLISSGGFRDARLPGQATCAARVKLMEENLVPPLNKPGVQADRILCLCKHLARVFFF